MLGDIELIFKKCLFKTKGRWRVDGKRGLRDEKMAGNLRYFVGIFRVELIDKYSQRFGNNHVEISIEYQKYYLIKY